MSEPGRGATALALPLALYSPECVEGVFSEVERCAQEEGPRAYPPRLALRLTM